MEISVKDLDATMRAFFEGRGDVVSNLNQTLSYSILTQYVAETSSKSTQPGTQRAHTLAVSY